MSRLMLAAAIAMAATSAQAISRYQSPTLRCGQIHSIIEQEGAAIFRYPSRSNPSLTLYDRYVSDGSLCASHQRAERVTIPALGGEQCSVQRCATRPDTCHGRGRACF